MQIFHKDRCVAIQSKLHIRRYVIADIQRSARLPGAQQIDRDTWNTLFRMRVLRELGSVELSRSECSTWESAQKALRDTYSTRQTPYLDYRPLRNEEPTTETIMQSPVTSMCDAGHCVRHIESA